MSELQDINWELQEKTIQNFSKTLHLQDIHSQFWVDNSTFLDTNLQLQKSNCQKVKIVQIVRKSNYSNYKQERASIRILIWPNTNLVNNEWCYLPVVSLIIEPE